ncbi:MAG: glycosyltransferase family 4 protein [Bacteroidales bacterium]|nr:glycosyltransferase family 4 protein [Bacteroidales bacterium]
MKQKIAKYCLFITLALVAASYLPWVYLTKIYYIFRYIIMALMGTSVVLTFSVEKYFSARFMRLFLLTIVLVGIEFVCFHLFGHRYRPADLSQLIVAFLCVGIGVGMEKDIRFWGNVTYFYTLVLIVMTLINCFYWAGGLYIPEHYMLDEGKNQIGGMLAIAAAATFFFGVKIKEQRTHFMVVFALAFLALLLIRARSDFFAVLLCALFIAGKDLDWSWKWNLKTVLTILGIMVIGYILYTGFIGDELTRFMVGGKSSSELDVLTSNRMERNKMGIDALIHDPLAGEMEEESGILLIHNYILLRLVRYGIWSLPLVGFYIYFGILTIAALFRERKTDIRDAGFVACVVPLLVSFVEPNFPYGPGSVQMLAFVLLGATFHARQVPPKRETVKGGKVLHICNDFTHSKVHTELYQKLDQQGMEQIIYTPIRKKELEGLNRFEGEHTRIIYSFILKPLHKFFFNLKIDKICKDIAKQVDLSEISYIHATNLFSDGAVALRLKERYGIPYITAVRNSDVNAFLRYTPHLWWVHRAVIRKADHLISITPALQNRLNNHWTLCGMRNIVKAKNIVIANGINDYWLQNLHPEAEQHAQNHRIVFVGNFDSNKNVVRLAEAVLSLKKEIPDIHLDLVGGTGNMEAKVLALVQQHPETLAYLGKIYEKDKLQVVYDQNSVFAMPSLTETFGLVYVEALSQGLSVLYTKGEGIDGLFEEHIGEAVIPTSLESIVNALRALLTRPEDYQTVPQARFSDFDWHSIAQKYQALYSAEAQNC